MKNTNQAIEMKWIERAAWRCRTLLTMPSLFDSEGACSSPVAIDTGAATKMVMK